MVARLEREGGGAELERRRTQLQVCLRQQAAFGAEVLDDRLLGNAVRFYAFAGAWLLSLVRFFKSDSLMALGGGVRTVMACPVRLYRVHSASSVHGKAEGRGPW